MKRGFAFLVFVILTAACPLTAQLIEAGAAQAPAQAPLTEKEVLALLKLKQPPAQSVAVVEQRGVDFEVSPEIEKALRKAKADDQFIQVVRNTGPNARAARAANPNAPKISQEEGREIWALVNELDADRAIQMMNDFVKKHPDSIGLTDAYAAGAVAYARKDQYALAVEYGEKSLKTNPDNLRALLLLAPVLPQPQMMRGAELDKEKKLADAEAYAKRAVELVKTLPKVSNETDEQFEKRKAEYTSQMHSALGMVHLQRASMGLQGMDRDELAKAEQEYQTAVTMTDQPAPQDYYRLGEVRNMLDKYDTAIEAFTKAGELGQGTVIKTLADQKIEELSKRTAKTAPAKQ